MRNSKVQFIVHAAMIAAIYVVLTYFISAFNLASGAIQVRISEALTILPYFTPAAIPGLFVGCLLANLLTGAAIYDVIFAVWRRCSAQSEHICSASTSFYARSRRWYQISSSFRWYSATDMDLPWNMAEETGRFRFTC